MANSDANTTREVANRGGELAALQGGDQVVGLHQRAARGIHQQRAVLHSRDTRGIDHLPRLFVARAVQRDQVARGQQLIETCRRETGRRRGTRR